MIKFLLSILINLLLIDIAYKVTSKLAIGELEHPIQFGIVWGIIFIVLGALTMYVLNHT